MGAAKKYNEEGDPYKKPRDSSGNAADEWDMGELKKYLHPWLHPVADQIKQEGKKRNEENALPLKEQNRSFSTLIHGSNDLMTLLETEPQFKKDLHELVGDKSEDAKKGVEIGYMIGAAMGIAHVIGQRMPKACRYHDLRHRYVDLDRAKSALQVAFSCL